MDWIEHGEKPTNFFLSLEKRNHNRKTIKRLRKHTGEYITDTGSILSEIKHFYEKLYSDAHRDKTKIDISNYIAETHVTQLSTEDR